MFGRQVWIGTRREAELLVCTTRGLEQGLEVCLSRDSKGKRNDSWSSGDSQLEPRRCAAKLESEVGICLQAEVSRILTKSD